MAYVSNSDVEAIKDDEGSNTSLHADANATEDSGVGPHGNADGKVDINMSSRTHIPCQNWVCLRQLPERFSFTCL